jgi:hypothetical protein
MTLISQVDKFGLKVLEALDSHLKLMIFGLGIVDLKWVGIDYI